MSRESRGLLAAVGLVFLAILIWFGTSSGAGPSTWSRGPRGLQLAYTYLEARGLPVSRWDVPLTELTPPGEAGSPGALVLALPLRRTLSDEEAQALDRWVIAGGRLLVLGSGGRVPPAEAFALRELGLESRKLRGDPPLWWFTWQDWQEQVEPLVPEEPGAPALTVRLGDEALRPVSQPVDRVHQRYQARGRVVEEAVWEWQEAEAGAEAGAETGGLGTPAVYSMQRGYGEVLVVNNGSAFGHGLLEEGDNLVVLEALARALLAEGGALAFDELHHGFPAPGAEPPAEADPAFWAVVGQLGLLWLLAVWTVSRPFGPPLASLRTRSGAVARELAALASLHRRGRHAPEAGARLLELARARQRRGGLGEVELPEAFEGGESELLALARAVGSGRG